MGVKLSKRGSYNFKKDLRKINKFERRAISYIALPLNEIYGDYAEDVVYYALPKSQSAPKLSENHPVNNDLGTDGFWKENTKKDNSSLTKKRAKTRKESNSKSLEDFLTQLTSTDDESSVDNEENVHTKVSRTTSQNQSEDDEFYDAQEYYDDVLDSNVHRKTETITKKTLHTQKAIDLDEVDNNSRIMAQNQSLQEINPPLNESAIHPKEIEPKTVIEDDYQISKVQENFNAHISVKKMLLETSLDDVLIYEEEEGNQIARSDSFERMEVEEEEFVNDVRKTQNLGSKVNHQSSTLVISTNEVSPEKDSESFSNSILREYSRILNSIDNTHNEHFVYDVEEEKQLHTEENMEIPLTTDPLTVNNIHNTQKDLVSLSTDYNFNQAEGDLVEKRRTYSDSHSSADSSLADSFEYYAQTDIVHNDNKLGVLNEDSTVDEETVSEHSSDIPTVIQEPDLVHDNNNLEAANETKLHDTQKNDLVHENNGLETNLALNEKKVFSKNSSEESESLIIQSSINSQEELVYGDQMVEVNACFGTNSSEEEDLVDNHNENYGRESETISELKSILISVNKLKAQIGTGANDTVTYQSLMKIMMEVNNVRNDNFDEIIMELQDYALSEIRNCLKALKSRKT